ncbi:MAG TPA: DUF2807 domain-containing protein [Chitinophagaceae bacterium]|nr:DUF2807 domain-containing protein [Chitinophagaceae bacterium]
MKKLIILLMACLVIAGQAWSQKTVVDENAQKRKLSGYHSIQVMHGIDLYLTQSDQEEVAVSASETKYRDNIVTEVRDGVLTISYGDEEQKWWKGGWINRKLKAYVSIKTLRKLRASGGSDVTIEDVISADDLSIDISGGSDLKANFTCNLLSLTASGGSDADLKGKATRLRINASGGSDVNAYQLTSDFCNVKCSGGSDVNVYAAKSIDANASGGSDIHYKGTPSETKTNKSGSSDIRRVL